MMDENRYYIKISPETLIGNKKIVCYPSGTTYSSGCTGVYTGFTESVEKLPCDDYSLISGITVPILLTETSVDLGYYSVFDGAVSQIDVIKNFFISGSTLYPRRVYLYNTSGKKYKNFLELSSFTVDWGDGSLPEPVTVESPFYLTHDYYLFGYYVITLTQTNPWGVNTIKKNISIPFTSTVVTNTGGTAYFTSNVGNWTATPISYDYIFTGDAINQITAHTSDNYTSVPFIITGETKSRINELRGYGPQPFMVNKTIYDSQNNVLGVINAMTSSYTAYTIQDINYFDYIDGTTAFVLKSYGLTNDWMVEEPITKDEALLNVAYSPEIQSNIFIERGNNSVLENIQRLGEVDNIGDMETYGYGFFNLKDNSK